MLPDPYEGLLYEVLRALGVPGGEPDQETEQGPPVVALEFGQRLGVGTPEGGESGTRGSFRGAWMSVRGVDAFTLTCTEPRREPSGPAGAPKHPGHPVGGWAGR